jgi:hypothetical protein
LQKRLLTTCLRVDSTNWAFDQRSGRSPSP